LSIVSLVNSNNSSLATSTFMTRKQMMIRKSQFVVLFHYSHMPMTGGGNVCRSSIEYSNIFVIRKSNIPDLSEIVIMHNVCKF
jgi:hypothetical protein